MGVAVGLNTAFSTSEESTYGTAVTTDRFYEILNEDLDRRNQIMTSQGMRAGPRNLRSGSRDVISSSDGGGPVSMEVPTNLFGRMLKHIMGGTSTIAQQGATTAYLQTHDLGSLQGKSLTIQKSLRDSAGTVISTLTFKGTKVVSAEFSIAVNQLLQATINFDSRDVVTNIAPAAVSYSTVKPFNFKQGTLKVDGSAVANVTTATVGIDNAQRLDGFYLGSQGLKAEPTDNDFPTVAGSLAAEFASPSVFYDRFAAHTPAALVLEFEGDTISGAYKETFRITVPDVRFTGGTPKAAGPGVIVQDVPFEGKSSGATPGMTIEYISTDTAI